jgi:ABC-type phosphate transport system substrate-binding protein
MTASGRRTVVALGAACLFSPHAWGADRDIEVRGGGSSFIRPVMQRWIEASKAAGMNVSYTVLGASTAQNQVLSGDVDFAAVKLPMSPDIARTLSRISGGKGSALGAMAASSPLFTTKDLFCGARGIVT